MDCPGGTRGGSLLAPLSGPEKQRSPWSLQGGLLGRSAASSSPSLGPRVRRAQQNTAPYLEGLHDAAVWFCFACSFLLENELRTFFYPRLHVRLVMKCLCRAQGPRGGALTLASFFVDNGLLYDKKNKKEIIREDSNCPGHCEAVWDSWLLNVAAKHLSLLHNPVRPLDLSVSRRLRRTSVGPCSQTHTKACFCTAWISQWDGRMHQWGNSVGSEG